MTVAWRPSGYRTKLRPDVGRSGDVVAELKFAFWVGLPSAQSDATPWRRAICKGFQTGSGRKRSDVHGRFNMLRRFRNRIAHHEPVFRRDLSVDHAEILEAIGWVQGRRSHAPRRLCPGLRSLSCPAASQVVNGQGGDARDTVRKITSLARDFSSNQLLATAHYRNTRDRDQLRERLHADAPCQGAAWVEGAAGWNVLRIGWISLKQDVPLAFCWIDPGHGVRRSFLHDAAEIHHRHPVAHMLHGR